MSRFPHGLHFLTPYTLELKGQVSGRATLHEDGSLPALTTQKVHASKRHLTHSVLSTAVFGSADWV